MAEDQEEKKKSKTESAGELGGRYAGRKMGKQLAGNLAGKAAGGAASTGAGTAAGGTAAGAAAAGGAAGGGAAAGATAGSVVPGLGTAVGAAAGAVGGAVLAKVGKKAGAALAAFAGLIALIVFIFIIFIVVIGAVFLQLVAGGIPEVVAEPPPTNICSPIPTTLSDANVGSINNNIDIYKSAASAADIPWEMLAAIHYVETGNDANAPNMYQFDPPPTGVDVNDFAEASNYAATFLQNKAKSGPVGIALKANMDPADPANEESIKDASWGYNGRADYMRDIAADLGFDPDTQGYEGSAYVMNRWDVQRISMIVKIFDADGNVIDEINYEIDGTWKLFILLRNATYDEQGKIIQLNEACFPESTEVPIGCPVAHGIVGGYLYDPPDHRGIDMTNQAAFDGNRVRSTHSGKVVFVSTVEHSQAGYWVTVENDTYKTRYLHLEPGIPVSLGQEVNRGDVVGIEDDTGLSSGRHLHYEVWKDGVVVDPTLFIPMENKLFAECKAIL